MGNEREQSAMDSFQSMELSIKVRQTVGGTGLDMLNFRQLGLLKRHYAEVAQPPDVIKSNANKRNNSPNCFGNP